MRFDPTTERLVVTVFFNTGESSTLEDVRNVGRPDGADGDYEITQENRQTLIPVHAVQRLVVQKEKRP